MMLRWALSLWALAYAVLAEDDTNRDDSSTFDNRMVLLNLYQATGGLEWNNSTNWFQQRTDVCDWHGVVCYTESAGDSRRVGEIQAIKLQSNHLVGTIPTEVFEIPYLESLDIDDNPDATVDFSALDKAQFLTYLDISNTGVTSLDNIEAASSLETLDITGLNLDGTFPSGIFQLTNLEGLFANENSFTGTLPTLIGTMTTLRDLYLYGNDLTGQIPSEIGSLTLLEALTLAHNAFGGTMPQDALNSLTHLKLLAIQREEIGKGDGITGSVPALSNHPYLTIVSMENQKLSGSLDPYFLMMSPMGETVEVDLSSNQISGTIPSSLNTKQYLILYLADNQITSVPTTLYDVSNNYCPYMNYWMGSDVVNLGCNAFLCPPGTWAPEGRATSDDECATCSDDTTLWGRTSCVSTTSTDVLERQILISLYNAMGGPNWKDDTNWLDLDSSVCDWYGIACVDGLVSSINLRNNGLTGTPPVDLFSLTQLQTLNLDSNSIEFSFAGIGSAINLQVLNLDNTDLPASALDGLGELSSLTSLTILSLSSNNVGGTIPSALFALTSLQEMGLAHNDFTGTLPTQIGQLQQLRRLYIGGNQLTGQLPTQLGALVNLQVLSAGENRFGGSLPTQLNGLSNLQALSLQQVVADGGIGGPLLAFSNLGQMTSLQLGSNQLTGSLPTSMLSNSLNLGSQITLGLSDNLLEGEVPSQWSRFDQLNVDLAGNRITSISSGLCLSVDWMSGSVGTYGCNAILCPQGTANSIGRQSDDASECAKCSGGGTGYMGARSCTQQSSTFGDDDSSESSILSDFFAATHGSGWTSSTNWADSADTCTFYGVECDGAGRVTKIDLTGNSLQGTVPASIFKLPYLNELILSENTISVDFEGIADASSLTTLKLDGANLASMTGIGNAPTLLSLSLANNALEGDIPRELYFLSGLRELDLSYNKLSGNLPNSIGDFSSLEILRLHHNYFTGRLPASLGDLSNLQVLNLAENNFEGTIPQEFNDLTNLQFLSLQREGGILGTDDIGIDQGGSSALGTGLTGTLPAFNNLPLISELYLGVNSLSGSIPFNFLDGVIDTTAAMKIDLTSNRLTGTLPASLSQFQDMSIYVADNRLSAISDSLCDKSQWLDGDVGLYQCNGILCPSGTYNSLGRISTGATSCQTCATGTNSYMGSFECLSTVEHQENSERDILETLYNEMNGDNWLDNTNWMDSEQSICTWYGIECVSADNPSVKAIYLENNRLLNDLVTSIYSLPNLNSLNLQDNDITFSFSGIQSASNLEYLDIAETGLTSLSGVSGASKLKLLRAHGNSLTSFPTEIFNLGFLETVSLSDNGFASQTVPSNFQNLINLQYLACANCGFTGSVPTWLGSLSNLEYLKLGQNALTGILPTSLLQLSNLKYLDLGDQTSNGGGLTGSVLSFNQTNLSDIYLQHNNLSGAIPSTILQHVSNSELVTLDLRYNSITGSVPTALTQISEMNLYLAANAITVLPDALCNTNWNDGNAGTHGCDGILCAKGKFNAYGRAIGELACSSCSESNAANTLGNTYCGSSNEHTALISLYSSTGGPSWTSDKNWLQSEDHCTWEGITCHTSGDFQGLVQSIELEQNNLIGSAEISMIWQLEGLEVLNLQKNDIAVSFSGIANAISLASLIISETKTTSLTGIGGAVGLKELHLTNSELQGPIPDELFSLTNLEKMYLSYNNMTGTLPTLVGQLTKLQDLYIFQNSLEGQLPSQLGLLSSVQHMALGQNDFEGTIPHEIGSLPLLEVLSLEKEEDAQSDSFFSVGGGGLSGHLPTLSGLPKLRELYLGHNSFSGSIPNGFLLGIVDKTQTIIVDLSYNNILGSVPVTLAVFDDLIIELGRNQISSIPDAVCAKTEWFNGEVANGCDAILCEPGTYNEFGRRIDAKTPCLQCTYPGSALDYGSVACGPVFADSMDDASILEELYDAAGGSEWVNNAGWATSTSFCDWYGVTCEPLGDLGVMTVTELDLMENNLNGIVPSILFHLPELRKLNVRSNSVSIGLNALFQAENLEELYLDSTLVSSLQGIGKATSLKVLHLHGNAFGWQTIPDELFSLVNLEELYLSDSMFGGTLPTGIGNLVNLARLSLEGNAFSGQIPSEIGGLTAMEELNMSNNNWFGTLPETFDNLSALKTFSLKNENPELVGVSGKIHSFATMPNLKELVLSNNQFTGSLPADFLQGVNDKSSLISVFLDGNNLVGTIPSSLADFNALNIYLMDNLFTAFGDGICAKSGWMDGNVGLYGCDAILCPAGWYSSEGRQISVSTECKVCPDADGSYLGSSFCASIQKQIERDILGQLYQATDGDNWKNKDGWMDDAFDVCSWYGIECKEGSTIESILLGGNRLVGTVPSSIFELPNLKFLWLYSNHVDISFDGIEQATSLRSLLLDATKLSSLTGIGNGISLIDIDVRFNNLQGTIPAELSNLENLESFIGSENAFTGTVPELSALRKLTTLRMSNNELTGTLPSFSQHPSLRSLDLSQNSLVGTIPPTLLSSVSESLTIFLDLSDNRLTGTVPSELARFPDLTLYLRNNYIEGISPTLCDRSDWNGGDVGSFGCDGILCPTETYSATGRASRSGASCERCSANKYFGGDSCGGSSSAVGLGLHRIFAIALSLWTALLLWC